MFGRTAPSKRGAPPPNAGPLPMGYHREVAIVADPDCVGIYRVRALHHQIGRGLQGQSGLVVNYDRGDVQRSFNYVLPNAANPIDAQARISRPADAQMLPGAEYNSSPSINLGQDPAAAAFWARIGR